MVEKIKNKKREKILVTGSGGMLGVDLCDKLATDYDVIGLDIYRSPGRPFDSAQGRQVTRAQGFIRCDITDRDKILRSVRSAEPDLIVHAAAWTDVDGCELDPIKAKKINTEGTRNISLAASELKAPFVFISTDFVFDGNKKTPYGESEKPNPLNVYGESKLEGEKLAAKSDKCAIIRTSWLYGANGKNFVDAIINKAKSGEDLKVVNDQVGSPTYTKDLAEAIERLINIVIEESPGHQASAEQSGASPKGTKSPGLFHISNRGAVSWFEYAKNILETSGVKNVEIKPIKSAELDRPAKRPHFSALDSSKFENLTKFAMRPWQEALREYVSERSNTE